jgi:subtilisin family serine protease
MRKGKIVFALIIIPFFLFSLNPKQYRLLKNNFIAFKQQKIRLSNKDLLPSEKASVKTKPILAEKAKGIPRAHQPKIFPFGFKKRGGDRGFFHRRYPRNRQLNKGKPYSFSGVEYVPGQVLVKFKSYLSDQVSKASIEDHRSKEIKRIPRLNIYQLEIPKDLSVEEMLFLLRQNPDVEYAQPNYIKKITVTPNDSLFSKQYALYNDGQEFGLPDDLQQGTPGADIKAREGWDETKGDEDIIIAILDTGIDFSHPDLKNKIHPGGYDFINDDPDPTDDHWHGTHVAGIAAAETNNNEGIAGVAWNCKILPIKCLDFTGRGSSSQIIDSVVWAVDNGAHVINCSFGDRTGAPAERDAFRYAYENNVVVVASAGNTGGAVLYPAAWDKYCLAVAAIDHNDARLSWSSNGPEIDVAAPGEWIFSTNPLEYFPPDLPPYDYASGTSMSSPHVAGLAALIISAKRTLIDDGKIKVEDIMNIIRYTADDVNSADYDGKDDFIGYGRVNMKKALVPIVITLSNKKDD